ncbi:MAG TPA: hypothetical protein VGS20_09230 [Candidatus Acidoferrales bacterium]|nr:hypothetical protein [Candidatus Acidoferrales bacterium]
MPGHEKTLKEPEIKGLLVCICELAGKEKQDSARIPRLVNSRGSIPFTGK